MDNAIIEITGEKFTGKLNGKDFSGSFNTAPITTDASSNATVDTKVTSTIDAPTATSTPTLVFAVGEMVKYTDRSTSTIVNTILAKIIEKIDDNNYKINAGADKLEINANINEIEKLTKAEEDTVGNAIGTVIKGGKGKKSRKMRRKSRGKSRRYRSRRG